MKYCQLSPKITHSDQMFVHKKEIKTLHEFEVGDIDEVQGGVFKMVGG